MLHNVYLGKITVDNVYFVRTICSTCSTWGQYILLYVNKWEEFLIHFHFSTWGHTFPLPLLLRYHVPYQPHKPFLYQQPSALNEPM